MKKFFGLNNAPTGVSVMATNKTEKLGHELTPNMRALRLTLRVVEELLSLGVSSRDVVNTGLDVTETYCKRRVYIDVSSTSIMVSQDRGLDHEPLTLIRLVELRDPNNMIVQQIQELVRDVVKGLPLDKAEDQFLYIVENKKAYPSWVLTAGNAGVGAGVIMLFTGSWVAIVTSFVIGCIVDRLVRMLSKRDAPAFFTQAASSVFITLSAVLVATLGNLGVWPFVGVSPTLIVVGGVVMLVAGLTIVATAQDAIDEFYVTASARFMKTFMMTAGLVVGIVVGLAIAKGIGSTVAVSPDPIPLGDKTLQIVGAVVIAVSWAVYTQSSRAAIVWAGLIGGLAWMAYSSTAGIGEATANGIGAFVVGFMGAVVARIWKSPSIAIINAAVVPLVPGLALYNGLMQFVGPPVTEHINQGAALLLTAVSVALAIAAGASFGNYMGRPIRKKLSYVKEYMPKIRLIRKPKTVFHDK